MPNVSATRLTDHGAEMLKRRALKLEWVEDTLSQPEAHRVDERDKSLNLAFRKIPEAGGRWLRVVYRTDGHVKVVVTAFFDRNQEKRR